MSLSFIQRELVQRKFIALDVFERALLLIIFSFFAVRMLLSFGSFHIVATPLLMTSELIPVIVILSRKWSNAISDNLFDWILAFMGGCLPLLSIPGAPSTIFPQSICFLMMLAGLSIQVSAKIILWHSFGLVAANRGVKIAGPYRFIRHPIYAGYTMTHIGFLLAVPSLWNTVLYSVTFGIQIARLLREERLLSRDPNYHEYSTRVHFRLCPGVF